MKTYEFDLSKYNQFCADDWFEEVMCIWFEKGLIEDLDVNEKHNLYADVYKECVAKFDEEINILDRKIKLKVFW